MVHGKVKVTKYLDNASERVNLASEGGTHGLQTFPPAWQTGSPVLP